MNRKFEGTLILVGVLGAIAAVMAMVTAWGPHPDCAASRFPYIIGCALGSYENLSGGLIAAGGALFAGWLAWSAVKEQIRLEKYKLQDAMVAQLQKRAASTSRELSNLRTAFSNGERLQRLLREARADPSPYASKLVELWRRQSFPNGSEGWLSLSIGSIVWDAVTRVRNIAREIEQSANMHTADQRGSFLRTREADAQEASESFSAVLAELPIRIHQLEGELADDNRQVTQAQAELRSLSR